MNKFLKQRDRCLSRTGIFLYSVTALDIKCFSSHHSWAKAVKRHLLIWEQKAGDRERQSAPQESRLIDHPFPLFFSAFSSQFKKSQPWCFHLTQQQWRWSFNILLSLTGLLKSLQNIKHQNNWNASTSAVIKYWWRDRWNAFPCSLNKQRDLLLGF